MPPASSETLPSGPLRLGPLLRYVGETSTTVWVETADAATVTVHAADRSWSAPTFTVHGHHYALVVVAGLEPGTSAPYTVEVDGTRVWPEEDSRFPAPRLSTLDLDRPTRLAFGSCRTSVPHDAEHHRSDGVDALRSFALALAAEEVPAPDFVAFLGDQVYADNTSEAMREFISSRRNIEEPPWTELKDYEEYAHLYALAWSDPANRWLLSTLPSSMIFDDHDIRDDWNTSWSWHQKVNRTSWWHQRLVGGLSSYWVYQHIGNLSPAELAEDQVWKHVRAHADSGADGEADLTDVLTDLVERNDRHPQAYRWSYARDLGDTRLVVVDSRAARVLEPDRRSMLDPVEEEWLDGQMRGDVDHLLVGTSLPFMLEPGLHDLEGFSEAAAEGRWGARASRAAERTRQAVDLEHWAAFNAGFESVFDMVMSVARGERGRAPASVTFLAGDVHHSYVAEVDDPRQYGARSRIVQAVCSPIRNPMPRGVRVLMSLLARSLVRPMRFVAEHTDAIPDPRYPWSITRGPWFDNTLAVLHARGPEMSVLWYTGVVDGEDHAHPRLTVAARYDLE